MVLSGGEGHAGIIRRVEQGLPFDEIFRLPEVGAAVMLGSMKTRRFLRLLPILSLLWIGAENCVGATRSVAPAGGNRPVAAEDEWCLDLFACLAEERQGNCCVSPLSLNFAMGIVQEGSRGDTRRELEKMTKRKGLLQQSTRLVESLKTRKHVQFDAAALVAFDPAARVAPTWDKTLREAGCSPSKILPLREHPQKAAGEINREIARLTRGLIPSLIDASALGSSCYAYIGNALYVQSNWASEFDRRQTFRSPFHGADGDGDAMFMRKVLIARYGRRLRADVLALDYEAEGLKLYLLLPDASLTLRQWLRRYSDRLRETMQSLEWKNVLLKLPRFDIDDRISVDALTERLHPGMAFLHRGDLSGMGAWPPPQRVGAMAQRCRFIVDETGVEAAAATGAVLLGCSAIVDHMPDLELRFDRPFLFFLIDESSPDFRHILFAGKVERP